MRLRRDRQPARPLRSEVLPGRHRVPGVRHRDRVPLSLGAPLPVAVVCRPAGCRRLHRWDFVLRPGRYPRVHGRPDRGARVRLAEARGRLGVSNMTGEFHVSKLDAVVNWARKFSLFQYPFVTACCGMEFMSVAAPKYDIARFGAEFPRFSPRQADLLIIVGTITERQGPA